MWDVNETIGNIQGEVYQQTREAGVPEDIVPVAIEAFWGTISKLWKKFKSIFE